MCDRWPEIVEDLHRSVSLDRYRADGRSAPRQQCSADVVAATIMAIEKRKIQRRDSVSGV